jgi:hypothetical protein
MANTPLQMVPGWSEDQVEQMKQSWITTAEQVVALSATPGGVSSLAEQLDTSEEAAQRLVEYARDALSPATRAEMEEAVDTSEFGLGALHPRQEDGEDG